MYATLLGPDAIVGLSTHTLAQIEQARARADFVSGGGPGVRDRARSTTGYDAVGVALVERAVAAAGDLPVVAIGGITIDRARPCSVRRARQSSPTVVTGDPEARRR